MTNREQAELYVSVRTKHKTPGSLEDRPQYVGSSDNFFCYKQVDKIGKNLNPADDPSSGLHSFDNPAAGLPPGY